jgi:hypothetical protein
MVASIPTAGFLRLNQIVNRPAVTARAAIPPKKNKSGKIIKPGKSGRRARPASQGFIPVSRSHFLEGVRSGKYPAGVKFSDRVTCWRSSDIAALVDRFAAEGGAE